MRNFYSHTDSTILECLSNRDKLGNSIRQINKLSPDEPFSIDIFNIESGALITHFEYP